MSDRLNIFNHNTTSFHNEFNNFFQIPKLIQPYNLEFLKICLNFKLGLFYFLNFLSFF